MRLVECSLLAPRVEHTVIYGVSDNDMQIWDNRLAAHLGYRPAGQRRGVPRGARVEHARARP